MYIHNFGAKFQALSKLEPNSSSLGVRVKARRGYIRTLGAEAPARH